MTRYSYCFAEDESRKWRIVFDPGELDLYVALYRNNRHVKRRPFMTVEDFLITRPKDELQARAHERFVEMLSSFIRDAARTDASVR